MVVPTFPEFNCQTWVYGSSSHRLRFIFLLVQKFLNELTLFNVSSFMIYFSEKSWNLKLYRLYHLKCGNYCKSRFYEPILKL
ncbi:hypothetical protein B1J93_15940 [Leptospira kirschneri serovar Pomona]|uniref:Uncharacterized protein n=1 Tax=Leptospira kirschneri serovar Pomona TaxID=561005 RepID=A0A1T1DI76_9LEPT|nr:hypothetical protein B1J93_15940 [Leptospira kirschneri serovar Pomona]